MGVLVSGKHGLGGREGVQKGGLFGCKPGRFLAQWGALAVEEEKRTFKKKV